MASICNYSHPEQQITEGLVRHKSGSLFPYNPEFYELASGLYGPGTIYCWYLLVASVIINRAFPEKDDEGYELLQISNDLLAALAYPIFAATDALIHAIGLLGTEYRALAIFCLRYPGTDLTGLAKFNHTQLDLRHIPPDILSLGQHVIDITGPLTVCYMFTAVTFVFVLLYLYLLTIRDLPDWRQTKWAKRLVFATCGYVILILTIFHLSLGDIGISFILSFYEALLPFMWFALFSMSAFISVGFVVAIFALIMSLIKRDKTDALEALKASGGCLILGFFFPGLMIYRALANGIPLVPDLAVRISERDQVAALIGGIVTLCFTLEDVYRSGKLSSKSEEE